MYNYPLLVDLLTRFVMVFSMINVVVITVIVGLHHYWVNYIEFKGQREKEIKEIPEVYPIVSIEVNNLS